MRLAEQGLFRSRAEHMNAVAQHQETAGVVPDRQMLAERLKEVCRVTREFLAGQSQRLAVQVHANGALDERADLAGHFMAQFAHQADTAGHVNALPGWRLAQVRQKGFQLSAVRRAIRR